MSADNQSQELLPCPFCGGSDHRYIAEPTPEEGRIAYIKCGVCKCRSVYLYTEDLHGDDVRERLLKQWNTRHTPTPPLPNDTKRMDFLEKGKCEGDIIDPASGRITRKLIDMAMAGVECPFSKNGKHKYYRDLDQVQHKMVESDMCAICGHKKGT